MLPFRLIFFCDDFVDTYKVSICSFAIKDTFFPQFLNYKTGRLKKKIVCHNSDFKLKIELYAE